MYQKPNEGEHCPFCENGKMVKNPKTGKIFCSEKCFLKKGEKPVDTFKREVSEGAKHDYETTGKIRHGVCCIYIQKDKELNEQTDKEIKNWVKYIESGNLPIKNGLTISEEEINF